MAKDLWLFKQFMLPVATYTSREELIANHAQREIEPAEAKVAELHEDRATEFLRSRLTR